MIAKYNPSSQLKCYQFFSRPLGPLTALFIVIYKGGKRFLTRLKNRHF